MNFHDKDYKDYWVAASWLIAGRSEEPENQVAFP
jgi:hypothetical protein